MFSLPASLESKLDFKCSVGQAKLFETDGRAARCQPFKCSTEHLARVHSNAYFEYMAG